MARGAALGRIVIDALIGLAVFCLFTSVLLHDGGARAAARAPTDAAAYIAGDRADLAHHVVAGIPTVAPASAPLAPAPQPPATSHVLRTTSEQAALGVLAIVFSLLFSLNLAFWRHLNRTYAVGRSRHA